MKNSMYLISNREIVNEIVEHIFDRLYLNLDNKHGGYLYSNIEIKFDENGLDFDEKNTEFEKLYNDIQGRTSLTFKQREDLNLRINLRFMYNFRISYYEDMRKITLINSIDNKLHIYNFTLNSRRVFRIIDNYLAEKTKNFVIRDKETLESKSIALQDYIEKVDDYLLYYSKINRFYCNIDNVLYKEIRNSNIITTLNTNNSGKINYFNQSIVSVLFPLSLFGTKLDLYSIQLVNQNLPRCKNRLFYPIGDKLLLRNECTEFIENEVIIISGFKGFEFSDMEYFGRIKEDDDND